VEHQNVRAEPRRWRPQPRACMMIVVDRTLNSQDLDYIPSSYCSVTLNCMTKLQHNRNSFHRDDIERFQWSRIEAYAKTQSDNAKSHEKKEEEEEEYRPVKPPTTNLHSFPPLPLLFSPSTTGTKTPPPHAPSSPTHNKPPPSSSAPQEDKKDPSSLNTPPSPLPSRLHLPISS
jgi:hypothetical protein